MITIDQLKTRHKEICDSALKLVEERGNEYAAPRDTLSTFRKTAAMLNTHPSDIADNMIALKVARMTNTIDLQMDSILDCINYLVYKVVLMEEDPRK